MKKFVRMSLVFAVCSGFIILALAACSQEPVSNDEGANAPVEEEIVEDTTDEAVVDESSEAEEAGDDFKVAFLFHGFINDGGFNTMAYSTYTRAQEEIGGTYEYMENIPISDLPKFLREFGSEGYDAVIAYSGTYVNAVLEVAPEFPETSYAVLAGPGMDVPDNVWIMGLAFEDAYFLNGALSAMMSKTGKLGYIGAVEIPVYVSSAIAYEEGAQYVNPDAEVLSVFVGDFNDPVAAKEAAIGQIEQGVDVIQGAVDIGVYGLFEAAREKDGVLINSFFVDQCDLAEDVMLSSAVFQYPDIVIEILGNIRNGQLGGYMGSSIAEGTAYLALCGDKVTPEMKVQLDEIETKLLAGEIEFTTQEDLQ